MRILHKCFFNLTAHPIIWMYKLVYWLWRERLTTVPRSQSERDASRRVTCPSRTTEQTGDTREAKWCSLADAAASLKVKADWRSANVCWRHRITGTNRDCGDHQVWKGQPQIHLEQRLSGKLDPVDSETDPRVSAEKRPVRILRQI